MSTIPKDVRRIPKIQADRLGFTKIEVYLPIKIRIIPKTVWLVEKLPSCFFGMFETKQEKPPSQPPKKVVSFVQAASSGSARDPLGDPELGPCSGEMKTWHQNNETNGETNIKLRKSMGEIQLFIENPWKKKETTKNKN